MATIFPTVTYRPKLRPSSLLAAAGRLLEAVATWVVRARQRHDLQRLNDAMLKDIGLSRCDVEYEVRKPFWRR